MAQHMGWLDADQPFKNPLPKRYSINALIPELLAVLRARNMRKTPEEAIIIIIVYHLLDSRYIVLTLARVLKMMEERVHNTFWWFFPWLD